MRGCGRRRLGRLLVLPVLAGLLSACAARPDGWAYDAAPRWETAFRAESSAALVGGAGDGWWANRRDAALIGDAGRVPTALSRSTEPIPDLSRARYLYLPRNADRMLFLPPTDPRRSDSYRGWR